MSGNALFGNKCCKKDGRQHAQQFQYREKSAYDHSCIGIIAKSIQKIAYYCFAAKLQAQKHAGQSDPQHAGAGVYDQKDSDS